MKQLVCEMCGSSDLIKKDGVFVCQNCGCKYSIEEAKKMMIEGTVDVTGSTVKVDNSDELANLYQIARRAKDDGNHEKAAKYYEMILVKDPDSWEAAFYSVLFTAYGTNIAGIVSAATTVNNCLPNVFSLIKKLDDNNKIIDATSSIMSDCKTFSASLKNAALNFFDNSTSKDNIAYKEKNNRLDAANIMENFAVKLGNTLIKDTSKKEAKKLCNGLDNEAIFEKALDSISKRQYQVADAITDIALRNRPTSGAYIAKAFTYFSNIIGTTTQHDESSVLSYLSDARNCSDNSNVDKCSRFINVGMGKDSLTLLMIAAANKDVEAVEYLLDIGADCNTHNNMSALWFVSYKSPESRIEEVRKIAKLLLEHGADYKVTNRGGVALYNPHTDPVIARMIKEKYPDATTGLAAASPKSGCYVATAVYGSYDCPEVWTLRRFRDHTLAETCYGRAFIHTYYAISPTLVKWFGKTEWFNNMWKPKLDRMVARLNKNGVEDTPYEDRIW